jgi:hypothetical protein
MSYLSLHDWSYEPQNLLFSIYEKYTSPEKQ